MPREDDDLAPRLLEDRDHNGEWRVEYEDDDGGCYVTVFAGPAAEQRASGYFNALKTGTLQAIRDERVVDRPRYFTLIQGSKDSS
jgi:hypothetical protein